MNNRVIVLTPLKPLETYEDQIRIAKECKMKEKKMSAQEKEKSDIKNECVQESKKSIIACNEKENSECGEQNRDKIRELVLLQIKVRLRVLCWQGSNYLYFCTRMFISQLSQPFFA